MLLWPILFRVWEGPGLHGWLPFEPRPTLASETLV